MGPITADSQVLEHWQPDCRLLDIPDEERWEEEIARILTREGYQVVR